MSRVGVIGVAAVAILLVSGCAPLPFACTAIGYSSTAHIVLDDPRPGLELELCDGAGCVPGPVVAPVEAGATEEPLDTGVASLTGSSTSGWSAVLFGGQPALGYRLTDSTGAVVAEGHVEVDWVRIDGDDRCGGNRAADVVIPG